VQTPTITAPKLHERLRLQRNFVLLDVRTDSEVREGQIPGAIQIPLHELEQRVRSSLPNSQTPIVVYCAHGIRSAQALQLLQQLGYSQVSHLEAGFAQWRALGLPVEIPAPACGSGKPLDRYSRQTLLAEVGLAGQKRLSQARVLLIGVGGLGSPAALYLAGAGVGTLALVDPDVVDISNLHRQIIHEASRLGTSKVESARGRIEATNPDVKVETFAERLCPDNAERIIGSGWDVIIDGADNFEARYSLNDVAVSRGIRVCHGSIDRFEGRVTTFLGRQGPCYRCLFPRQPQPGTIGSCAERGVLGVLPGVIGTLQATEALKLILGIGQPLSGRLLTYDALNLEFRVIYYGRDPNCPVCPTSVRES
jgi:sulfur-carrier protein adenylyltransferase/sulfurtransferase